MAKITGNKRKKTAFKRYKKAGLPPGTLVYDGEPQPAGQRITVMSYNEKSFEEKITENIEDAISMQQRSELCWINIDGLENVASIDKLGKKYGIHPLVLEDIVHTRQRPKMEDFDEHIYVVLKMITYDEQAQEICSEQVSIVLGRSYVISFQERVGDVFEPLRDRIRNSKGRVRKMGADYLMYCLLDSIVDNYFAVLERIGDRIETLQDVVTAEPTDEVLHDIHNMKSQMLFLRKAVWPLREMISNLQKLEAEFITPATQIFLRDVYDHIVQTIDTTEALREMISGILDVYLSSISNKMNAVMKVLTVIATIFIPLTFVAGIYGMNFQHMPELGWRWAYPAGYWTVNAVIVIVMLAYFRKKKWL